MIKTVSEFLNKLRAAENAALKKQDIEHRPTIGDMYEGLTKSLLAKALPLSSQLEVTSGFIVDASGNQSDELDCLVVTADGERIPYTDKYKFLVDDVVAVIQVKKNLYSSDIDEGYNNLLSVAKFSSSPPLKLGHLLKDAFQSIAKLPFPERKDLDLFPDEIQMLYRTLLAEIAMPARIILGYNGFKSHERFRASFVDYLLEQPKGKKGYGPMSFPNLIICDQFSLVKCNGMPFIGPLTDNLFWHFYASSSSNPLELLLEIIWTRLVYRDELPTSVFDDDIWLTPMNKFISAKCVSKEDGTQGWAYDVTNMSEVTLQQPLEQILWEPAFLDDVQLEIVLEMCKTGELKLNDTVLNQILEKHNATLEEIVSFLSAVGIAARYKDALVFLTRQCQVCRLPDGRSAAGENIAGQLTRWFHAYMKENANR